MSVRPKPVTTTSVLSALPSPSVSCMKRMSGAIGDPHAAVADGDARRDIQPLGEDGDLVDAAVAVGVFQHFDPVASRARLGSRIFEAFGDPDPPPFVERHGDGVDEVGLGGDELRRGKPGGTVIFLTASAGERAGPGGLSWPWGICWADSDSAHQTA